MATLKGWSLTCIGNRVADLSPVADLLSLKFLYCCSTVVSDLTPLTRLIQLQSLDCADTRVADLSPLAGTTSLRSLRCRNSQVADLTPLTRLTHLQSLDCARTPVADLSPLAGITSLQSLSCGYSQVADLTPLTRLIHLQSLDCSGTQVADLSPLAGLIALQSLGCGATKVTDLSPLAGLAALRGLACWHSQVADLAPLAKLTALQELDCRGSRVVNLSPLSGLSSLKLLKCGWTFGCSPTSQIDLTPLTSVFSLQTLYLWEAVVSGLPEAAIRLPGLRTLIIKTQPSLGEIPAEALSQTGEDNCLPRLRAHLADLGADAQPLRDVKVIVLGNGRVGKTQICRRLRDEPFETDAKSTHGISVTSLELMLPDGETPAIINLWDFGGQDLYHGTHALFMRTRAVFLLVWKPERERGEQMHGGLVFRNQPLPYWLEYIRHLGGDRSPVILVQTRCDGGLGECPNLPVHDTLLQPLLADDRFFTRVAYSAKDDCGRARLLDALQQAVIQLRAVQGRPLIGRNRLAVWDQLRALRDADARETNPAIRQYRLLPYRDFAALCAKHGIHGAETFVVILHHAGLVFYHPHLFDDQLVLDQSWALNAVYALFTREGAVYPTLRQFGGRFTRPLLDALLWRGRGLSTDDQRSLIGMMETSGICFVYRRGHDPDETEYIAPDLLPDGRGGPPPALIKELAARWVPIAGEVVMAFFRYPFLSPASGRLVLSDLGGLAGATALYWRDGLCLYDAGSRATAIVEVLTDVAGAISSTTKPDYAGCIRIQVKGESAERLLATLI